MNAVAPSNKQLYRAGGISAIGLGIAYLVTIALFASVGAPPSSGVAWLKYLNSKATEWSVILGLSVLTDLLYIPVALALYSALQHLGRTAMLIAVAFVGLFICLDLAVTWANYGALIGLAGSYAAANSETQRIAYIAAADYPAAVLASPLEVVYSIVLLSFAIFVIGFVMLKGVFNKPTAYLGLATGVFGITAISAWSVAVIANAVLATAWVLLVGYRLYRLGGHTAGG